MLVKPDHVDDFIRATSLNHQESVKEPGKCRFDCLQSQDDPSRFLLYGAYVSADHAAAHKQTPHDLAWRDAVVDWMAEPRRGVPYRSFAP